MLILSKTVGVRSLLRFMSLVIVDSETNVKEPSLGWTRALTHGVIHKAGDSKVSQEYSIYFNTVMKSQSDLNGKTLTLWVPHYTKNSHLFHSTDWFKAKIYKITMVFPMIYGGLWGEFLNIRNFNDPALIHRQNSTPRQPPRRLWLCPPRPSERLSRAKLRLGAISNSPEEVIEEAQAMTMGKIRGNPRDYVEREKYLS